MAYQDRETHYDEKTNGNSAGWFMAGALVVALIAGGLLYANGFFTNDEELSIELNVPNLGEGELKLPDMKEAPLVKEP
ncbi:hypothetical protein GFK91_26170 [Roseibium aggregatum]|uniref:hypothetical protein n=1 Tax=Roseibium aggregatum TaxID=187304 RepID=UPI001E2C820C|nr:hypothetical protein [Roseibium aggregatum]UES58802.1 hypothetical protein GFK91_26170 [Roseibium aggregatum]